MAKNTRREATLSIWVKSHGLECDFRQTFELGHKLT